ncbi:MAG: hypothetical protein JOZ78_17470 [Chroococcidiopsidaceae cyanobacterium CP_BM_ER_R8_30]|nr:hypothetical protein [Chroococcidiopsidaceae cyanobacterium CP_BM_ER_R8_30]
MTLTFDKNVYGSLLVEFQPKVISTEEENERALQVVEKLMAIKNRTLEQNTLLELLVTLIEKFEDEHYQLNASTPHSILQHLMEARGLKQADLVGILGSRGVVSEVVNGKRDISKAQAKALGEFFHIPPTLFL